VSGGSSRRGRKSRRLKMGFQWWGWVGELGALSPMEGVWGVRYGGGVLRFGAWSTVSVTVGKF
jgi:hypothetical protein